MILQEAGFNYRMFLHFESLDSPVKETEALGMKLVLLGAHGFLQILVIEFQWSCEVFLYSLPLSMFSLLIFLQHELSILVLSNFQIVEEARASRER